MSVIVSNNIVNKDALQQIYAAKLQHTFGKFAKAIALRDVKVTVTPYDQWRSMAPAWSDDDGLTVTYDPASNLIAADNLLRLKGLLIHELSHILYTPRSRTALIKWVRDSGKWSTFNMLEDSRIENMMVANMSGISPWLIHTITVELLSDDASELLPLIWGRKYLPKHVRTQAKNVWVSNRNGKVIDPDATDRLCTLIDEYITLNLADTKVVQRAKEIILEVHGLLTNNRPDDIMHKSTESSPNSDGSTPVSKSQQDKLIKQVVVVEPDDSDDTDEDTAGDDAQDVQLRSGKGLMDSLEELKEEAFEDVLSDIKSTIQNIRESDAAEVHGQERNHVDRVDNVPKHWMIQDAPQPSAQFASRKFAQELLNLQAQHDPGWVRNTDSGRVNVKQFMVGAEFDEMFDAWDDGNQDVSDIECVVMLDSSGSMSSDMMNNGYNAMWAIKRALDSINASTTVIQFASSNRILYSSDERATSVVRKARTACGGSTNPFKGIKHAADIFKQSRRAIKLFITITDGAWDYPAICDQQIANLRLTGVLTSLVFLSDESENLFGSPKDSNGNYLVDAHKCEFSYHLTDPSKIVDVAKQLTRRAQRAVLV